MDCTKVGDFPRINSGMQIDDNALLKRNSNLKSDIMMAPHQTKGGSMDLVGSEKRLEYAIHPAVMTIARQLIVTI